MCIFLDAYGSGNVINLILFVMQLLFKSTTMYLIGKNVQ